MAAKFLAKITIPKLSQTFILNTDWNWECENGGYKHFTDHLNFLSSYPMYSYSPAHGAPGRLIAVQLAKKYKGKVEFPPGRVIDMQYLMSVRNYLEEQKKEKEGKDEKA